MNLTVKKLQDLIKASKIDIKEVITEMQKRAHEKKHLNIIISNLFDKAISDSNTERFIPFAVKDNFLLEGTKTTAASKMLLGFDSPYTGTILKRLSKSCVFTCKTNMDEFAMGSSGKTSFFGPTLSPLKNNKGEVLCPGGSSSGSAAAVASGISLAAIGTDTGGSGRYPAAVSGIVGLKPTYGCLSRFGIIDFASSLDCASLLTQTVEDCEILFNKCIGKDFNDPTSIDYKPQTSKKKVAIFCDIEGEVEEKIKDVQSILEKEGYCTVPYSISMLEYVLPIYFVISSSEASSNLSRYTGISYGDPNEKYLDLFEDVRSKCFGEEVKRRIILGNYTIYTGNMNAYYIKARRILSKLYEEMDNLFKECDAIIMPSTSGRGMTMQEAENPDPIAMYKCDTYTCLANLLGLPAISVPCGFFSDHSPLGLQIMSKPLGENLIFDIAKILDREFDYLGAKHEI
jgi:aspartyl-tRNA(Asn)/glutamyl-tRNA(Gln) amidotransferase subunit A